jgi:hypothetical protein
MGYQIGEGMRMRFIKWSVLDTGREAPARIESNEHKTLAPDGGSDAAHRSWLSVFRGSAITAKRDFHSRE